MQRGTGDSRDWGGPALNSPATGGATQGDRKPVISAAVVFLLAYGVIRSVFNASLHRLWFDELCAWFVVQQPNLHALWLALMRGADSQPPPFYLVEKLSRQFIANDQVALRLPAAIGFCCMLGCVFLWLRRRYDAGVALVAASILLITPFFTRYTAEARGYGLLGGALSLALLAYRLAPQGKWMIVLAFSLAAAESSHFYAFVMMSPFFAAEGVFALKEKCFRWQVWAAFFCGVSPLILFWPIVAHMKSYYTEHAWMHPAPFQSLRIYGWLLGIPHGATGTFSWSEVAWISVSAICLSVAALLVYKGVRADPKCEPHFHENVLAGGFLLLPIILFVMVKTTHALIAPRYLLPVSFGIVMAAAKGLDLLNRRTVKLIGVLLFVTIALQEAGFWLSYYGAYQLGFRQSQPVQDLVSKAGHAELPVVLSDGHDYLETEHYASPEWKQRLTFVADYRGALAHGRSDFNDKELLVLRDLGPLRVIEYPIFKERQSEFLLYSDPTDDNDPDWFIFRLLEDHWSLQKLVTDGHSTVYLVKFAGEKRQE